jgi:hypothetical protein
VPGYGSHDGFIHFDSKWEGIAHQLRIVISGKNSSAIRSGQGIGHGIHGHFFQGTKIKNQPWYQNHDNDLENFPAHIYFHSCPNQMLSAMNIWVMCSFSGHNLQGYLT